MPQTTPFSQVTSALLDTATPFPPLLLHLFSDISLPDLKALLAIWPQVALTRKHTLLEDLEELAERDTLLSFDDLATRLLSDPDPTVRTLAIRLLWQATDLKLIPIFIKMVSSDEDHPTRAAAASALGLFIQMGELEEVPAKALHEVEACLLSAHKLAPTELIRRRALESLGASSLPEVAPLIEAAYHRAHKDWKQSALFAMGRSIEERYEKFVLAHLLDPDEDLRSEAITAAGKLGLASARLILLDSLADEEDTDLRRDIVWALSEIGGEGVRTRLDELLESETDEDELDFLEESLENLLLTQDLDQFDLLHFGDNDLVLDDDDPAKEN